MADYNFTDASIAGAIVPAEMELSRNMFTCRRNVLDFSIQNTAAADTVKAIAVPAGTLVKTAYVRVITADATQTMDIGDGTTADAFGADVSVATAGDVVGGTIVETYFSSAGYITLTVPATMAWDTLKCEVIAEMMDVGDDF